MPQWNHAQFIPDQPSSFPNPKFTIIMLFWLCITRYESDWGAPQYSCFLTGILWQKGRFLYWTWLINKCNDFPCFRLTKESQYTHDVICSHCTSLFVLLFLMTFLFFKGGFSESLCDTVRECVWKGGVGRVGLGGWSVCVPQGKEVCGMITQRVNPTEPSVDTQTWEVLNENFKKPSNCQREWRARKAMQDAWWGCAIASLVEAFAPAHTHTLAKKKH